MTSVWLAPTYRRPPVEFITTSGERVPLPVSGDGASDFALDREGWIAVQVGSQIVSLRDGDLLRPTRLPDASRCAPAADARLVVLQRSFDRSQDEGEPNTFQLVDSTGSVLRSLTTHLSGVVGELATGVLVTGHELVDWDGQVTPLPVGGEASAVLRGRFVVFHDDAAEELRLVDMDDPAAPIQAVPYSGRWLGSAVYDSQVSRALFDVYRGPVVIVSAEHGFRFVDLDDDDPYRQVHHYDTDHFLLTRERSHVTVNIATGARRRLTGFPMRSNPRIDVTGRVDLDLLRQALAPKSTGPISPDDREAILRAAEDTVRTYAEQTGVAVESVLAKCSPAVRLRSCFVTGEVPLAASRFGGRPDLPRNYRWPTLDGAPMMFVGQFRADELNAALPGAVELDDVLIVVFVALEADGGYPTREDGVHVAAIPIGDVVRRNWPTRLVDDLRLQPALAVPEPMLSIEVDPDNDDDMVWWKLAETLTGNGSGHQLLGGFTTIQRSGSSRRAILRIGNDPLLGGPEFGDGGSLLIGTTSTTAGVLDLDADFTVDLDSY